MESFLEPATPRPPPAHKVIVFIKVVVVVIVAVEMSYVAVERKWHSLASFGEDIR